MESLARGCSGKISTWVTGGKLKSTGEIKIKKYKYLHGIAVHVGKASLECVVDCCEHLFGIENTARTRLGDKNAGLAHLRHHDFVVELFETEGDPWFRV